MHCATTTSATQMPAYSREHLLLARTAASSEECCSSEKAHATLTAMKDQDVLARLTKPQRSQTAREAPPSSPPCIQDLKELPCEAALAGSIPPPPVHAPSLTPKHKVVPPPAHAPSVEIRPLSLTLSLEASLPSPPQEAAGASRKMPPPMLSPQCSPKSSPSPAMQISLCSSLPPPMLSPQASSWPASPPPMLPPSLTRSQSPMGEPMAAPPSHAPSMSPMFSPMLSPSHAPFVSPAHAQPSDSPPAWMVGGPPCLESFGYKRSSSIVSPTTCSNSENESNRGFATDDASLCGSGGEPMAAPPSHAPSMSPMFSPMLSPSHAPFVSPAHAQPSDSPPAWMVGGPPCLESFGYKRSSSIVSPTTCSNSENESNRGFATDDASLCGSGSETDLAAGPKQEPFSACVTPSRTPPHCCPAPPGLEAPVRALRLEHLI
eukprot:TRINITY_DN1799_c0_g1_i4.p1 TRINITY_DN1799_c0_g1~~TRINITY_DN1799_c0_g1_i4.p1  ORF type:complete len:433 (-),score=67.38 TRINITY_DN1799_c0_g1_i4:143-1441(-)